MSRKLQRPVTLDAIDIAIVSAIEFDPRATAVRLEKQVPLSRTAIAKRLKRLDHGGLLVPQLRSSIYPDLGLEIEAIVDVDVPVGEQIGVTNTLLESPNVLAIKRPLGVDNVQCHVVASCMADLSRFVEKCERSGPATTNLIEQTEYSTMPFSERMAGLRRASEREKHGE